MVMDCVAHCILESSCMPNFVISLSLSRYVLQAVLLGNYRDIFKFVGFIGNFFWKMNLILNNLEYDRENRYKPV